MKNKGTQYSTINSFRIWVCITTRRAGINKKKHQYTTVTSNNDDDDDVDGNENALKLTTSFANKTVL